MNFSELQRQYDAIRARDCEQDGEITECPECGRRVFRNNLMGKIHCIDIEYCAWSKEL